MAWNVVVCVLFSSYCACFGWFWYKCKCSEAACRAGVAERYTRLSQKQVPVRGWGFESLHRHLSQFARCLKSRKKWLEAFLLWVILLKCSNACSNQKSMLSEMVRFWKWEYYQRSYSIKLQLHLCICDKWGTANSNGDKVGPLYSFLFGWGDIIKRSRWPFFETSIRETRK